MTKLLDQTIAKVRMLPEEDQNSVAGALLEYLETMNELSLSDHQLAELRRRRALPARETISIAEARRRLRMRGP